MQFLYKLCYEMQGIVHIGDKRWKLYVLYLFILL